jgi:flagellar hook-length control protein FliK
MRIFVLPVLSAAPIAAANGPAVMPGTRDSKPSADSSPFAVMLAATAPAAQKPRDVQPQADNASPAKPADKSQADTPSSPQNPSSGQQSGAPQSSQSAIQQSGAQSSQQDNSTASVKQDDTASGAKPAAKPKSAANDNNGADPSELAPNPQTATNPPPQPDPSSLLAQIQPSALPAMPSQPAPADKGSDTIGAVGAVDSASAAPQLQTAANIPADPLAQVPAMPQAPGSVPPELSLQEQQQAPQVQQPQPVMADDDNDDSSNDVTVSADPASGKQPTIPSTAPVQPQPAAQSADPALLAALKIPAANAAQAGKPVAPASSKPTAAGKPANDLSAPQTPAATSPAIPKSTGIPDAIKLTADDGKPQSVSSDAVQTGNDAAGKEASVSSAPAPSAQTPPAQPTPASPANLAALSLPSQPIPAPGGIPSGSGIATATLHLAAQTDMAPNMDSLAVQIAARSQSGAKQFDIRLDPPELGRVEVRLSIDASGKAQAHMTADQPDTLNLLQKDSASLTQALRDAGLNVARDGVNFSLRGQGNQNGGHNGMGGQNGNSGRRASLSASHVIDSIQTASILSLTGAAANASLDIHV